MRKDTYRLFEAKSRVMATNTWIGNYYVGADGKWVK